MEDSASFLWNLAYTALLNFFCRHLPQAKSWSLCYLPIDTLCCTTIMMRFATWNKVCQPPTCGNKTSCKQWHTFRVWLGVCSDLKDVSNPVPVLHFFASSPRWPPVSKQKTYLQNICWVIHLLNHKDILHSGGTDSRLDLMGNTKFCLKQKLAKYQHKKPDPPVSSHTTHPSPPSPLPLHHHNACPNFHFQTFHTRIILHPPPQRILHRGRWHMLHPLLSLWCHLIRHPPSLPRCNFHHQPN